MAPACSQIFQPQAIPIAFWHIMMIIYAAISP
jgi:hypothetical protein